MRCLLIFAKEPLPGTVKTRLAAAIGASRAVRLYRAFLEDTARWCAALPDTRVEWWVAGSPSAFGKLVADRQTLHPQPTGDLGHRLRAAFRAHFQRRSSPALAIGTDCPGLGPAQVLDALHSLEDDADLALVPAEDGGYVALGMAREVSQLFEDIPWSTAAVLRATLARAKALGLRVRLFDPLYDVDTAEDLSRLRRDLRRHPERAPATAAIIEGLLASPDSGPRGRDESWPPT